MSALLVALALGYIGGSGAGFGVLIRGDAGSQLGHNAGASGV
jgi:hypothetical protein